MDGLPALSAREAFFYQDRMDLYREVVGPDGNPLGYQKLYECVPLNFHRTPNFDRPSPAGMSKEVNLMTANVGTCQYGFDVRSLDLIFVTTRHGDTEWQAIDGAPKKPVLIPHTFFYCVPTPEPTIYVPAPQYSAPGTPCGITGI